MESIFENIKHEIINKGENTNFEEMQYDSRKIKEGDIFVALKGYTVDGHKYIEKAIERGAKLIILSEDVKNIDKSISYVKVKDLRKKLGLIASNYYNWPQKSLKIIGITGTNGKTTSTYLFESIFKNSSRIGTIEYKIGDKIYPAPNTTPESLDIIKLCKESKEKSIEYLIMEVSSHALDMGRVDMLEFDLAIFTNLSQDHLDYHKTMDRYFESKKKLFEKLKDKKRAVINIDSEYGKKLYDLYPEAVTYSEKEALLMGEIIDYTNHNMKLRFQYKDKKVEFISELMGEFNLYNMMGVGAGAIAMGMSLEEIAGKLEKSKNVPGRFEIINKGQNFMLVVDYAHTEDGLENILKALNKIKKNKIITVFGTGGDRDKSKRPKMAKVAAEYSDFVIISSDNPRTEDPLKILEDIEYGLIKLNYPRERYLIIADREEAIKKSVEMASENDIVLIAGKGHEDYQIIGREKIHFDDREMAMKYIEMK